MQGFIAPKAMLYYNKKIYLTGDKKDLRKSFPKWTMIAWALIDFGIKTEQSEAKWTTYFEYLLLILEMLETDLSYFPRSWKTWKLDSFFLVGDPG